MAATTVAAGSSPISVSVSGTSGAGGWYVSDVFIDWTLDPLWTASSGCVDETVGETSSHKADCSAQDGLGGTASDSVTVKVDKSPPSIEGHANVNETTTNSGGKNVSFSPPGASDNGPSGMSGVACVPSSGSHFPVGETTVTCHATDNAGLQSGPSSFKVILTFQDPTPPVITESISGTPGNAGWYRSDVTVTWTVTDPDSSAPGCTPDVLTASGQTAECSSTSAGGTSSKTVGPFQIDKTVPTVTVPAPMTVEATSAAGAAVNYTATASESLTPACAPASGAAFGKGTTTVNCTATDAAGNQGAASFTVTVQDTTRPVLGAMPAAITTNATSAAGAIVSYTPPTATDNAGPATVACTPGPGSTFPVGATTVSCTATDSSGNTSLAPGTFTVTVNDTTAPTLGVHAPETAQATSTAGAVVNYALPSATDNVTAAPVVTCAPAPGSTFPIGTTTVTCTARDAANNAGTSTFTVTVVDTTPPVVSVPADRLLEAAGPGGTATFFEVTASDLGEPLTPGSVSCSPKSGTTFPLGNTTVTCTATDPRGNSGSGSFKIGINDSTPPSLFAPSQATFFADGPGGISREHPAVARVLSSAGAQDLVDETPSVTHNAPANFPMGDTTVVFRAADDSGNATTANMKVTVTTRPANQPTGQPANTVDVIPPQNVRGLTANSVPGVITIKWQPVGDAESYEVYRANASDRSTQSNHSGTLVYRGKATRFDDRKATAGIEYRYTVVSVDKAGNKAVGEVVIALAKKLLLLRPAFGAKFSKPPALVLATVSGASYYNIQLFRGTQKILSVWPAGTRHQLALTWKYGGKAYRLSPGVYRWYAWPGIGARDAAKYGSVMGESTFTIVPAKATKKAAAKKSSKAKKSAQSKKKKRKTGKR